jgi:hypothetical protein
MTALPASPVILCAFMVSVVPIFPRDVLVISLASLDPFELWNEGLITCLAANENDLAAVFIEAFFPYKSYFLSLSALFRAFGVYPGAPSDQLLRFEREAWANNFDSLSFTIQSDLLSRCCLIAQNSTPTFAQALIAILSLPYQLAACINRSNLTAKGSG